MLPARCRSLALRRCVRLLANQHQTPTVTPSLITITLQRSFAGYRKPPKKAAAAEIDDDDEIEEWSDSDDEDDGLPKMHKRIEVKVKTNRLDAVLAAVIAGFNRTQVEQAVLTGKLRCNGHRIEKKADTVHEGETYDLILSSGSDQFSTQTINRYVIRGVHTPMDMNKPIIVRVNRTHNLIVNDYEE